MKIPSILLLVAAILLGEAPPRVAGNSLRCYTCVSMPNDLTCLNDPDSVTSSVPITDCDMDGEVCCTINRVNYLEDETKLQSFSRSCIDDCSPKSFQEIPDSTYVTYITTCKTPQCNVGPGDEKLPSNGQHDAKSNEIWGVKGLPSSSGTLTPSLTATLTATLILLLLRRN